MQTKIKTLLLGLSLALITTTGVQAAKPVFMSQPKNVKSMVSSIPLYSETDITPNGLEIVLDSSKIYAGTSTRNPCSDMNLIYDERSTDSIEIIADSDTFTVFSDDLPVHPQYTCVKEIDFYHGKKFETPNIVIKWQNNQPIQATPSNFTMDYSS